MPNSFPFTEIKGGEGQRQRVTRTRRKKASRRGKGGEGDRKGGAEHLREMDLGAPRGHILFPFEAPDKSNVAECIIR